MKIKAIKSSYNEVSQYYNELHASHVKPIKPNLLFRTLLKLVSMPDLIATKFKCKKIGMEKLGKNEPAFFFMNHSSFIDLEIVASTLYPRHFNIITTQDGFIGKDWLMRQIGCIPTKKFVSDTTLVRDMLHATKKLNDSIVMFPEAGYTLDGTTTALPDSLGRCVKMLGIPLVMITTYGAFARDPLYNNLQKRKVKVSATMEYLLSKEDIQAMSDEEIQKIILKHFEFDNFKWQKENGIKIPEKFRADGLERLLYKCPSCKTEGKMLGKGTILECKACNAKHELSEYGELIALNTENKFPHIPDWYAWERKEVKAEIDADSYSLDIPVNIWINRDTKKLFDVGDGRLVHDETGFVLTSDDGEIHYHHKPLTSHTICADFNFYEVGDVIALASPECVFYCFPKDQSTPVVKSRLAAEEIYKIASKNLHNANLS